MLIYQPHESKLERSDETKKFWRRQAPNLKEREKMTRVVWVGRLGIFALGAIVALAVSGCGGGGSSTPPPVPNIQNINSSTTPTSPVNLSIEINGSGFQAAP